MAEEDSRIRFVERRKKGVSSARNQGIEETDGEFLTFVDADDKLDARMFEVLADCLEKEKQRNRCVRLLQMGRDGERAMRPERKEDRGELCGESRCFTRAVHGGPRRHVGQYLLHGNTRCWSVLYRRSAVANVRFREDLTIGEDMMFLVESDAGLKRITLTDYRGYFYRINENGAMLRPFTLSYMDEIKGWKLACEKISAGWPEQKARVNSILAVSAMLAAGKLSRLSAKERAKYREQAAECRRRCGRRSGFREQRKSCRKDIG